MIESKEVKIIQNKIKVAKYPNYNYIFRLKDGFFVRWGKNIEDNPEVAPAPEILDIEVTTSCSGVEGIDNKGNITPRTPCKFCYKSNTPKGKNMSLDTFKQIINRFSTDLTQIAIGSCSTMLSNPDLFKMAEYARENNIVPNITAADLTKETAERAAKIFGAIAISRYQNKNICYNSVKYLTDAGLKQVNIHLCVHTESYDWAVETMNDIKTDKRLEKLNALVLLSLKQKGRGIGYTPLTQKQFNELVKLATELNIPIGFDSCSAPKYLEAIKDDKEYDKLSKFVEPCEAACFSSYIDVNGEFFPCSFSEGNKGWEKGINVLELNSINELWKHPRVEEFRHQLLNNKRNCPIYNI